MPKFHYALKLKAPPDKAWAVLGDIAGCAKYIPGMTNVKIYGSTRVCSFANGAVQHEEISNYSNDGRSYRYTIEGSPLPVKNNRGGFAVEADGHGSQIVWDAEFEVLNPAQEGEVSQMWDGACRQVLDNLKQLIEGS